MITRDPAPAPGRPSAATVTCDAADCDETLRTRTPVSTSMEAWWQAQDQGWANRPAPGAALDLCPFHASRPAYLQGTPS